MKVVDPGHEYELATLDGLPGDLERLYFVKRDDPPEKYPGNQGHNSGVIIQEVLRALIDRIQYLDDQIPDDLNMFAIAGLRSTFMSLEIRAHRRHDSVLPDLEEPIETYPACPTCGHIFCTWCTGSGGAS